MLLVLQVATIFLVSIAWALALLHALELPGKLRLSQEALHRDAADLLSGIHRRGRGRRSRRDSRDRGAAPRDK